MPRIPRYKRTQSLPGTSGGVFESADVAAAPGRAVAGLADAVGTVAVGELKRQEQIEAAIGKIRQRMQQEERVATITQAGVDISESGLAFETDQLALSGTDAYDMMPRVDKWYEGERKRRVDGVKDPETARGIVDVLNRQKLQIARSLSRHEARERAVEAEAAAKRGLQASTKAAYLRDQELPAIMEDFQASIAARADISDEQKTDQIMAGESAIAASHIRGITDRNPEAAIELMESGLYNKFLDTRSLSQFRQEAQRRVKAKKADEKTKQLEAERHAKEEMEAQQEAQNVEFGDLMAAGELTEEKIEKSILDSSDREYWRGRIASRKTAIEKAVGGEDGFKTKQSVKSVLVQRINSDPTKITPRDIDEMVGQGLSPDDAERLKKKREDLIREPLKSATAKNGQKILDDALKAGVFGDPKKDRVQARAAWAEKVEVFQQYMVNHPDAKTDEANAFLELLLKPDVEASFWGRSKEEATRENLRRDVMVERMAGKTLDELISGEIPEGTPRNEQWRVLRDTETGRVWRENVETGEQIDVTLDENGKVILNAD